MTFLIQTHVQPSFSIGKYEVAKNPGRPWKTLEQKLLLKKTLQNFGNVIDTWKNFEITPHIWTFKLIYLTLLTGEKLSTIINV